MTLTLCVCVILACAYEKMSRESYHTNREKYSSDWLAAVVVEIEVVSKSVFSSAPLTAY